MFSTLKEQLDLVEVAEEILGVPFKQIGDATWAPENETCPHCGHKDCYRIKKDGADSFYKCFSCDKTGDVISMVQELVEGDDGEPLNAADAAKRLAKKYKISLPRDYSPVQEAMDMAATYYHQCFLEAGGCAELGGLTPVAYQKDKRQHTEESFQRFQIGWSDGKLGEYFEAMGIAAEIVVQTGLLNKAGKDFLPAKTFIYPHKVRGRVSHFTFKDPLKQKEWQLPNKHKLNGHSFYNSDSLRNEGPVIVVEGENDCISVAEAHWLGGLICCNGSISQSQLDWMSLNLKDRDVITMYDSDAAGDKYREKTAKYRKDFKSLLQVKLGNGIKDIDEYLKEGGDLEGAITNPGQIVASSGEAGLEVEGEADSEASPILEHKGAYYKVKLRDGNEYKIKLTNFTIKLLNIFIRGSQREREILIIREDGKQSDPLMIPSEAKVSLKPFKTLAANAIDASFYGKEDDMIAIWEHVYRTSKEVVVHLPECVGYVKEFKGWLFGDSFISEAGALYKPDENGVIWTQNKSVGLRAMSIETNGGGDDQAGVPKTFNEMTSEQREELIGGVLTMLAQNLGVPGAAVNIMAWAWASVYSEKLYTAFGHFPFLYQWGSGGRGKTTIQKWVLAFFDMEPHGWTPANQLNSGVSFSRKLSYYSSLPMCVDEVKLERATIEMYGIFRSWYNRGGRTVAASEGSGIRTQAVRSSIMFGGEDQFADPSTRQRCIHVRIPKTGREEKESYHWIDNRRRDLPAIGYHWVLDSTRSSWPDIVSEVKRLDGVLRDGGISSRTSLNWAMIAYFGLKLCAKYLPEFDYMEYMFQAAREDVERQQEDNTLTEFWNIVEGMQAAGENAKIDGTHLRVEGDFLHVWFAEVFRIVSKEDTKKEMFSKRAIMEALREEDYFVDEGRQKMGVTETQRRVFTFDLRKAPDVLQQIASIVG